MADILVRGLDSKLVARLKKRAKANGRSLQSEAKSILQSAAGYSRSEALAVALRWQRTFAGKKFEDSVRILRRDRRR